MVVCGNNGDINDYSVRGDSIDLSMVVSMAIVHKDTDNAAVIVR